VQLAAQAKGTKGRKLRLDTRLSCRPPFITPGACGLLADGVRVLSRFVQWAKGLVQDQVSNVQQACCSRLRTARWVSQTLHSQ
jgi:IS5 family transposase